MADLLFSVKFFDVSAPVERAGVNQIGVAKPTSACIQRLRGGCSALSSVARSMGLIRALS